MEVINFILNIFKENNIQSGQILPKSIMNQKLKELPLDKKSKVRDAWHFLVGNGFIQEGNPEGPMLTRKGEEYMKQNLK